MSGINPNRKDFTITSWSGKTADSYAQSAVLDLRDSNDGSLPHGGKVVGQIDTGTVTATGTITIYAIPWARASDNQSWAYARGQRNGGLITAGDGTVTEGTDFLLQNIEVGDTITIDVDTLDNSEHDFEFDIEDVLGGIPEGLTLIVYSDTGIPLGTTNAAHLIEKRFN